MNESRISLGRSYKVCRVENPFNDTSNERSGIDLRSRERHGLGRITMTKVIRMDDVILCSSITWPMSFGTEMNLFTTGSFSEIMSAPQAR